MIDRPEGIGARESSVTRIAPLLDNFIRLRLATARCAGGEAVNADRVVLRRRATP